MWKFTESIIYDNLGQTIVNKIHCTYKGFIYSICLIKIIISNNLIRNIFIWNVSFTVQKCGNHIFYSTLYNFSLPFLKGTRGKHLLGISMHIVQRRQQQQQQKRTTPPPPKKTPKKREIVLMALKSKQNQIRNCEQKINPFYTP